MEEKKLVENIADIDADFSQWYSDVVAKAKLADYGPVKGTMIIREYGYEIWEHLRDQFDAIIKKMGVKNSYFPMFIPLDYFAREAEHVEGFAPELATVTKVGKTDLAEPFALRPTSETIICEAFSRWLNSYKDLPMKVHQWANIIRMEKTTRPFLRTTEFLWQEGHCLFATEKEADEDAKKMLQVYHDFCRDYLALPMFCGKKTESEKFAGAKYTLTIECMMRDGKSLQSGTTHNLGQNFTKAFNIKYLDKDEQLKNPYYTSWGISTRLIGAIIMVHGDKRGLRLPPPVAPIQVGIVPIQMHKAGVLEKCTEIFENLNKKFRCDIDTTENTPGWKFAEYELKGVPIRLEIGPRDLENGQAVVFRRDLLTKEVVKLSDLESRIDSLLKEITKELYNQAKASSDARVKEAESIDALKAQVESGYAVAHFCGDAHCEDEIKAQTGATTRCYLEKHSKGKCICCGKETTDQIYFAKNY